MNKNELCHLIDELWVPTSARTALKWQIRTRVYSDDELQECARRYENAIEQQQELVQLHAPGAVAAESVQALRRDYAGQMLRRKQRNQAAKLLRHAIKGEQGLDVPADLSRDAVDPHLRTI